MIAGVQLPILHLEDFLSGQISERSAFVQALGSALENYGFVKIKSQKISEVRLSKGYQVAQEFFKLSAEEKMNYYRPEQKGRYGYMNIPNLDNYNFEQLEMWVAGGEMTEFPQKLPDFEGYTRALFEAFHDCAGAVLRACALYLDLKEEAFTRVVDRNWSMLRYFHYRLPPCGERRGKELFVEHQDKTLISLLAGGTAPGLEIQVGGSEWLPVFGDGEGLLLAGAELLHCLSGGVFKGGNHRVVSPSDGQESRFTIIYSSLPHPDLYVEPLLQVFKGRATRAVIPRMTFSDYLYKRPHGPVFGKRSG